MRKRWDDGVTARTRGEGAGARGSEALARLLGRVRRRWRLRLLLRGLALVLGAGLVAFVASAFGVEWARFSPGAVTVFRWLAWGTVLGLGVWFVVRPMLRRVSDEQVALYLEEHEPSLEAAILGAVEARRSRTLGSAVASPELLDRLVARAVERARAVDGGRRIDQSALQRASGALAGVTLAALLILLFGPAPLRTGLSALWPTTDAASVNPYFITVLPGDVTVARGSDQFVQASLGGFTSEQVTLFTRRGADQPYQRFSMIPTADGSFESLLLDLDDATDYFVESDGIRSSGFRIEVADLPYVGSMEHEYRFPAYTGLEPRLVEHAGDIAALPGTRVLLRITPTVATPSGRLVMDADTVPLELASDGTLVGTLEVRTRGFYEVELALPDGSHVPASPQYAIDLLRDAPPSVRVTKPGRDTQASPIEEVYLEVRADDDYGVGELFLAYSVNGEAEDTLHLQGPGSRSLAEVTAGHTLYLEDYELEPGDVVSFYAVARDQRGAATEAVSDIYFLNIRPFGVDFREAEQQGGPPGGGGEGGAAEPELSELQRQVIAATFNLNRDRARYDEAEFGESTTSVALAQGRVREQVGTLVERMTNRGLAEAEDQFRQIAEMLPEAIAAMETAETHLRRGETREALGPEQQALRVLQKAEETYERYVGMQQQGGGGGGGGGTPDAEDLADLFELELDKLRNQYETVQRGERQQNAAEVDELMEKLDELARRQQAEAERQRARAQQGQAGGGGSAAQGQRELADEAEEAARQLQRLSRETGDARLDETARRLQEAADAMRNAAAQGGTQGSAEAARALDRLEEAQRRLERSREDRIGDDARGALGRVERLQRRQQEITRRVENLSADPAARREQVRDIQAEKTEMAGEVGALRNDLERLSADARREDPEAARAIGDAARAIEESNLQAKLLYSRGTVEQRESEMARIFERGLEEDFEALRRRVADAREAAERLTRQQGMEEALDRAQDLVRGVESLERRLDDRGSAEPGEAGEQAAAGQPGQPGEPGEPGQPGQPGEPGGAAGREGDMRGGSSPLGGRSAGGPPRAFSEEEIRQYRREFEERYQEGRQLRDALRSEGRETADLDRALEALDRLRTAETYQDLPQIAALRETLRENLGRVEFVLRREVRGEAAGRASLRGSDDVPPGFQRLVEEYYRSLARGGGGGSR
jgi:hypothetical protein